MAVFLCVNRNLHHPPFDFRNILCYLIFAVIAKDIAVKNPIKKSPFYLKVVVRKYFIIHSLKKQGWRQAKTGGVELIKSIWFASRGEASRSQVASGFFALV